VPYSVVEQGKRNKWVTLIGILKLFKGIALVVLAVGLLKLLHKDVAETLTRWIERLNADPNNQYFQKILQHLDGLNSRKLALATIGTLFYAALFLTEGIGLLLRRRWGEYFTVIVTGSFLPLEVYELTKKFNAPKLIIIIINVAIVWYLVWRLRSHKREGGKAQTGGVKRSVHQVSAATHLGRT
jgi:uncharacterized membrane protein (DUF2068 family)